jgi:chitodextrinase
MHTNRFAHLAAAVSLAGLLAASSCSQSPDPSSPRVDEIRAAATATEWKANTSYAKGDLVTFEGITYQCRQAHRSAVGQEPPRTPALWMRPTPSGIAEWTVQTNYVVGSGVTHEGSLYECIQAHVSDSSDWVPNRTPALWRCASQSCGGGGCKGLKDGSLCDDGKVCTGVDKCKAGKCVPGAAKPAGTSCADANVCNGNETCDGKGVCKAGMPAAARSPTRSIPRSPGATPCTRGSSAWPRPRVS